MHNKTGIELLKNKLFPVNIKIYVQKLNGLCENYDSFTMYPFISLVIFIDIYIYMFICGYDLKHTFLLYLSN